MFFSNSQDTFRNKSEIAEYGRKICSILSLIGNGDMGDREYLFTQLHQRNSDNFDTDEWPEYEALVRKCRKIMENSNE